MEPWDNILALERAGAENLHLCRMLAISIGAEKRFMHYLIQNKWVQIAVENCHIFTGDSVEESFDSAPFFEAPYTFMNLHPEKGWEILINYIQSCENIDRKIKEVKKRKYHSYLSGGIISPIALPDNLHEYPIKHPYEGSTHSQEPTGEYIGKTSFP